MGRDWKKWAADRGLQKWFRKDNFIVLVLAGILLVIIALPTKKDGGDQGGRNAGEESGLVAPQEETDKEPGREKAGEETDEAYATYLEESLTEALSQMAGVGKVKVMITLKSSRELVVEKEETVRHSATSESDAQGGTRTVNETDSGESAVYRTESGASEPYVVKTLPPRIEGVLVVAEGAGNGTVSRNIVEIAEALFGVEAHKVKVVKMVPAPEEQQSPGQK